MQAACELLIMSAEETMQDANKLYAIVANVDQILKSISSKELTINLRLKARTKKLLQMMEKIAVTKHYYENSRQPEGRKH